MIEKVAKEKFILLGVIGLSLISVTARFNFYHTLFGVAIAILCMVIFETLRVACLWSLVVEGSLLGKITAVPIYSLTAITCAFAAITPWVEKVLQERIYFSIFVYYLIKRLPCEFTEEVVALTGIIPSWFMAAGSVAVRRPRTRLWQGK